MLPHHHADLLDPEWWQATQEEIRTGRLVEVLSYSDDVRFATPPPPSRWRVGEQE